MLEDANVSAQIETHLLLLLSGKNPQMTNRWYVSYFTQKIGLDI